MAKAIPAVFRNDEARTRYLAAYDDVLRAWPVPYEALDIPTPLGMTHVIASGPPDAPTVLLLPSLAASAMLWQPNVAALSAHFRVYAVDVIGQVGRSVPSKRIRDRREMADWLSVLMDGLGVNRAALVGASYGGFLALNQAILAPDRVSKVVLIGPAATFQRLPLKFYYAMLVKGPLRRLFRRKPAARLPGGARLADSAWGRLMQAAMTTSAKPNLASAIVFSRCALRHVRAPVLLLVGEREVLYDAAKGLAVAKRRMPTLRGEIVPNADHLASLSAPDFVNARILDFLRP